MEKVLDWTIINEKVKAYIELIKLKLTLAVVFSGVFGYCLAIDQVSWWKIILSLIHI